MLIGCLSTKRSVVFLDDSRKVLFLNKGDVVTSGGVTYQIDFTGVLVSNGRYFQLIKYEDYCIQHGVVP